MRPIALAATLLLAPVALAGPELLADLRIPDTARDLSGLKDTVGGVPHDSFGSWGSALEWTGADHRFIALADRGPLDGGAAWRCRWSLIELPAPATTSTPLRTTIEPWIIETRLLSDDQRRPLMGNSGAYNPGDASDDTRFDPEAVRMGKDGTVYIAEEYAPAVVAFSPEGTRLRRFFVPARFQIAQRSGLADAELPPANTTGRQPNRGFEGLALTPDGSTLLALLQSPLIQDAGGEWRENKAGERTWERVGVNVRLLTIDIASGATRELVYPLRSPKHGLNEILAIDSRRMLVIERDGKPGDEARFKKIMLADLGAGDAAASDVSGVDALPARTLPSSVRPIQTRELIDLLDPAYGLAGPDFPEKIEGLSWGPSLPDGRRVLVITSDNDLREGQPTRVWMFAIDPAALAGESK